MINKETIVTFYDEFATRDLQKIDYHGSGYFPLDIRSPYTFLEKVLAEHLSRQPKPWKVLDVPCGQGLHSIHLAKLGASVTGVDISTKSLEVARARAEHFAVNHSTEFLAQDCEELDFPENSFDAAFCSGSLYYLDAPKIAKILQRIVKPGGMVVFVESLSENPVLNLNRMIKNKVGRRTDYVTKRLFSLADLQRFGQHFANSQVRSFNLCTLLAAPLRKLPFYRPLVAALTGIDSLLFKTPFFARLAFKAVLVANVPPEKSSC